MITFLGATANGIVPIWINGKYVQVFCDFETGKYTFAFHKSVITEVFYNILKTEHILFAFKMEDHLEKGKNINLKGECMTLILDFLKFFFHSIG